MRTFIALIFNFDSLKLQFKKLQCVKVKLKPFYKIFFLFIVLSFTEVLHAQSKEKAFISVPVADLMVEPYYKVSPKKLSITDYYEKIPFSGSWSECRRAHQLLFNEIVTVLEERGPEIKVRISNFYFHKADEPYPMDTYWTLRKNVCLFKDLKHQGADSRKLPPPISYKENNIESEPSAKMVTLKKPFYDPVTKQIYSVGTRFVLASDQDLSGPFGKGHFDTHVFDVHAHKMKITQIPKSHCVRNYSKNPKDKIKNFVQVLRLWAYQKDGAIPYVLGGWSWTVTCANQDFEISKESDSKYAINRNDWAHGSKTGFDCMGLIGRAAQICDIPFYIKNSTTLLKDLKTVKKNESLSEGDIIWYPGHVMVISSLKKNLVIEARGYERGEGKVQETSVESIFKNIKTLSELKAAHDAQKPVTVLYYDGRPWRTFKRIKILKLNSIWDK